MFKEEYMNTFFGILAEMKVKELEIHAYSLFNSKYTDKPL